MTEENMSQIMQAIKNNFNTSLTTISAMAESKNKSIPQDCYKKHSNDVDKFSDCINNSTKKINNVMEDMNFRLYFISRTAKECLTKGNSLDECITSTVEKGKPIIESIKNQL